jgi:hypothetical protein
MYRILSVHDSANIRKIFEKQNIFPNNFGDLRFLLTFAPAKSKMAG